MQYITGQDRQQSQFFSKLDDFVSARHYVRLIDLIAERFVSENQAMFLVKGILIATLVQSGHCAPGQMRGQFIGIPISIGETIIRVKCKPIVEN